ncbi:MAG: tRNA (adenosine(37)-N6)-threonylcarbamoyltransferase complex ATPase subunit type 1 TsaE [Rickettsiales bacterium]
MIRNIQISSESELKNFVKTFAKKVGSQDCITLVGDLGVGKTTLSKYLIQEFFPDQSVTSPTFPIVNHYQTKEKSIYHYDLYRVKDPQELEEIGFEDSIGKGLVLIEWPEIAIRYLPKKITVIKMEHLGGNKRLLKIKDNE